jgi:hypothetical protein
MLRRVLGFLKPFYDSVELERKQLNRDAGVVIQQLKSAYRAEIIKEVAVLARQEIVDSLRRAARARSEAEDALPETPLAGLEAEQVDLAKVDTEVARCRKLHRESRRGMRQVELTAYTLAIIYLRSLHHAEGAAIARRQIEALFAEWSHLDEDGQSTLVV